ncbi:MAG: hypothetical protein IPM45_10130 [Acidimicrobiales bacterium]|nr:hypothetical protein [Acidimicrobiales bacterium]
MTAPGAGSPLDDASPPWAGLGALRAAERRLRTDLAGTDDAVGWLDAGRTALDRALHIVTELQLLRSSADAPERLARLAERRLARLVQLANQRHGRRRLFGGLAERAVARGPDGFRFVGDQRPVMRRIGPDLVVRVNPDGRTVFGFDTPIDLLSAVQDLATRLREGDRGAAERRWDDLEARAADLQLAHRAISARLRRVRASRQAALSGLRHTGDELLSALLAEPADAQLHEAQGLLARRALADASRVPLPSLADFLR